MRSHLDNLRKKPSGSAKKGGGTVIGGYRRWLAYGLPIVAIMVLMGGATLAWLLTPPAMPGDATAALKVLTSPRFTRLDDIRKQRYHDRIGELFRDMDADARLAFREQMRTDSELREQLRNMMRDRMRDQARRFADGSPEERVAMLDEMIDRRGQWGGDRGAGPPRDQAGPPRDQQESREPREPRGDPRERAADRFEQGNPQDQALMGEFFRALRARSQQRGGGSR